MLARNDNELKGAYEDLQRISADDRLRREYEAREAWLMDERSRLKQARREGMEEGMQKGVEKGMQKGVEKGKLEIAKNALEEGLDMELIEKLTGLSRNELENKQQPNKETLMVGL